MARKNDKVHTAVIIGDAEDEAALLALCPDLPQWPQRWQIASGDLAVGERIVEAFKPFLRHLIQRGLAVRLGAPLPPASRAADDELAPIVARILALLDPTGGTKDQRGRHPR